MKPIVTVPNIVLTSVADPVTDFNQSLSILLQHMRETLLTTTDPKGVGLAAPQIGVALRIFITKQTATAQLREFINPVILHKSDALNENPPSRGSGEAGKLEGCLSIPKIWGNVHRAKTLTLRYQDPTGATHVEKFNGFLATIIQHETDHVNGILFTQRVLEQKEKLYQTGTDDDGKEVLEEISLS